MFSFRGSLVSLFFVTKQWSSLKVVSLQKIMDTCWGQPRFPANSAVVEGKGITDKTTDAQVVAVIKNWDNPIYLAVLELEVWIRCDAIYIYTCFWCKKVHWQHNLGCSLVGKIYRPRKYQPTKCHGDVTNNRVHLAKTTPLNALLRDLCVLMFGTFRPVKHRNCTRSMCLRVLLLGMFLMQGMNDYIMTTWAMKNNVVCIIYRGCSNNPHVYRDNWYTAESLRREGIPMVNRARKGCKIANSLEVQVDH